MLLNLQTQLRECLNILLKSKYLLIYCLIAGGIWGYQERRISQIVSENSKDTNALHLYYEERLNFQRNRADEWQSLALNFQVVLGNEDRHIQTVIKSSLGETLEILGRDHWKLQELIMKDKRREEREIVEWVKANPVKRIKSTEIK